MIKNLQIDFKLRIVTYIDADNKQVLITFEQLGVKQGKIPDVYAVMKLLGLRG